MLANIIWPSLFIGGRMLATLPISVGLAVEILYLRAATTLNGGRCILAGVAMNLASALVGVILVPLSGLAWEFVAGFTIYPLMNVGTFNPVGWCASAIIAAIANALIEGRVLKWGFGLALGRRGFWLLALVNLVTVALACYSLITHPPKY